MKLRMTKVILVLGVITLLGAGCNASQDNVDTSAGDQSNANTSTQTESDSAKTISMTEVQSANNEQKCWTVIEGSVYDLTDWAAKHPGGKQNILKLCGTDGTSFFNGKHGGQPQPVSTLEGYKIGTLE